MEETSPSRTVWFCASPDGNKGPFNRQQMLNLLQQGVIGPDSYIWRKGLDNWVTLRESGDFEDTDEEVATEESASEEEAIPQAQSQDDYLDNVFVELVKESWDRYKQRELASEVDEVLVGAVITASLDNGYSLIDLESSGSKHHLRFEDINNGNRTIFRLTHHAESLLTSQVLGHQASVTIGYGERVKDFKSVWKAIKQEMKGGYITQPDPGIITVDGDISSQYIYVQVRLLWDINDYLNAENPYQVNYPKMTEHIGATIHALRKYLQGRLSAT